MISVLQCPKLSFCNAKQYRSEMEGLNSSKPCISFNLPGFQCRTMTQLLLISQEHIGRSQGGAYKWMKSGLKKPGIAATSIQQIWTGGSRNKIILSMFLKLLKINSKITSCPHSHSGRPHYQKLLPSSLRAQKMACVLLAVVAVCQFLSNAQCLYPTDSIGPNWRPPENLSSLGFNSDISLPVLTEPAGSLGI